MGGVGVVVAVVAELEAEAGKVAVGRAAAGKVAAKGMNPVSILSVSSLAEHSRRLINFQGLYSACLVSDASRVHTRSCS